MQCPQGTWPFLSAVLVNNPQMPQGLPDDIESFVHVILWHVTKFHKHDLSGTDEEIRALLAQHVYDMYIECHVGKKGHVGCRRKLQAMKAGDMGGIILDERFISLPFLRFIERLLGLCQGHYKSISLGRAMRDLEPEPPILRAVDSRAFWEGKPTSTVAHEEASVENQQIVDEAIAERSELEDHSAILNIFKETLDVTEGWKYDKQRDQFKDLPELVEIKVVKSISTADSRKRGSEAPSENFRKRGRLSSVESEGSSWSRGGTSRLAEQDISSHSSGAF